MSNLHPKAFALLRVLVMEPETMPRNRYFTLFEDRTAKHLKGRAAVIRKLKEAALGGGVFSCVTQSDDEIRLLVAVGDTLTWETVLSREEFELLEELFVRDGLSNATGFPELQRSVCTK